MRGDKVRISKGPMKDYEGTLVENKGSNKIAIEVKNFNQCLLVNVAVENIVKL
jgi:transcription antitermination factor NusG